MRAEKAEKQGDGGKRMSAAEKQKLLQANFMAALQEKSVDDKAANPFQGAASGANGNANSYANRAAGGGPTTAYASGPTLSADYNRLSGGANGNAPPSTRRGPNNARGSPQDGNQGATEEKEIAELDEKYKIKTWEEDAEYEEYEGWGEEEEGSKKKKAAAANGGGDRWNDDESASKKDKKKGDKGGEYSPKDAGKKANYKPDSRAKKQDHWDDWGYNKPTKQDKLNEKEIDHQGEFLLDRKPTRERKIAHFCRFSRRQFV